MNLAPLTATISLSLLVWLQVKDWLFNHEPTFKMVTTYGSFVLFCATAGLQLTRWTVRWWKKRKGAVPFDRKKPR